MVATKELSVFIVFTQFNLINFKETRTLSTVLPLEQIDD